MKKNNLLIATATLVVLFFVGLTFQSCDKTKNLEQSQLEGYWVLKTMNGKEAKSIFTEALPTLQFNFQDTTVSGTGSCNQYQGAYTYKDGILSIPRLAITQMFCGEASSEGQFFLELSDTNNILSIVDGLLTITHNKEVLLQFEKGQPTQEETAPGIDKSKLEGQWKLKNIDGSDATTKFKEDGTGQVPSITFNLAEGRINGNSGCNIINASFTLNNDELILGPVILTQMACANLEGESQFNQAIADTSTLTMPNDNVLQVAKKGAVLLEFEKVVGNTSDTKK